MRRSVEESLIAQAAWLGKLRLVSTAEVLAVWLTPLAALALGALIAGVSGPVLGLAITLCHLKWLAISLGALPRRFALLGAAFCLLSMGKFLMFGWMGFHRMHQLGYLYYGLTLLFACLAALAWIGYTRRWRALAEAYLRDDFRWLVTAAPLPLRWRAAVLLRRYTATNTAA
jgi:hypothetical protein